MSPLSVGAQLRQARLARQVELRDITTLTKIQPWVLEALETDQLHRTMSTIYVKSFLATYAKYLQLDGAALTAQLFAKPEPEPAVAKPQETPLSVSRNTPSPAPRLLESQSPVVVPTGPGLIEQVWTALWPLIRRVTVFGAGIAALVLLVRVNPLQQLAARVPRHEASVSVPAERFAPPSEAPLRVPDDQPLSLEVRASRPTWVSVKADGKLVSQQQLAAGSKETWQASRRFELIVGSPSKVAVALNGQSITPRLAAHHGRVLITHTSIKPLLDDRPSAKQP